LGVFEFVLVIVAITTVGKVLEARASRPVSLPTGRDPLVVDEAIADLNRRLERLEEERDFYRALLEAPSEADGRDRSPPG
jgi:sirohydrochlorin ferrochelatase